MTKVIIDRIEGEYAVVEDENGNPLTVPCALFKGAREGDVFGISLLREETDARRARIQKKMDRLFKR